MKTKSEIDGQHPSSNYLVITDPDEPSTWHLRVRNTFGQLDHKLMGDAWAALHEGFRGQKYEGPNKQEALRKLTELYHSENMRLPDAKNRASEKVFIYNRSASDASWIHIVPKGELTNKAAGIVQLLDDKALNNILANIEKDRLRMGEDNWPGIYAGREHFIYDDDKDSEALAWFKDFEKRDDGIWAKSDGLTPIGRQAVQNRQYKYTSFVADRGDLERLDGNRYRVNKIETVGFTNMANGKELLKPILNRAESNISETRHTFVTLEGIPRIEETALYAWFDAIASILKACRKRTGCSLGFQNAWNLAKAQNPDIYHQAFGRYMDAQAAPSEEEAQAAASDVSMVTNRVQTASGMDFRFSWNFVRENLPYVFNRRFNAIQSDQIKKPVNADNYAGVQKRAQKQFLDLVLAEQAHYGIKGPEALTRVSNRNPELKGLANYEITPQEAFSRAPALEEKLLNRERKPTATLQVKANRLFEKLINDEKQGGKSNFAAYRLVMNRDSVLCDLVNRKITTDEAFERQPSLRERIEKVYVPE